MSIHPSARRADLDETGAQPGTEESGVVALAVKV